MIVLTFDIDFDFESFELYKLVLEILINEGWEVHPSISEIKDMNYKPSDNVCCYAIRKWVQL